MLAYLLTLCDEKDRAKVEDLYYTYHDEMVKIAKMRLRLKPHVDAETFGEVAVSDAFCKIITYFESIDFNYPQNEIKAYVFKVLANACRDLSDNLKKYNDYEEYDDNICSDISDEDFLLQLNIVERKNEVIEAIKQLKERYSIVMFDYFCEGKSVKLIAKEQGMKLKTVYTNLSRGKDKLLELLDQRGYWNGEK